MSKCPLLIATPNHWVVDCYGEECVWFHSVCKQPQKAKTNADRIRAMTDEEMAIMASTMYRTQELIGGDVKTWLTWLKQECDDNGT